MIIDCKGLECPQPVINTKKALESIAVGEWLEIKIDSKIVLENVLKFINYSGLSAEVKELGNEWELRVQKTDGAGHTAPLNAKPNAKNNTKNEASFTSDTINLSHAPQKTEQKDETIPELTTPKNHKKVIYLNEDRAGSGEVGISLLAKLLGSFVLLSDSIEAVVCVNNAVYISASRSHPALGALKELEQKGVRVISCGACLSSYNLIDKVQVGEVGNAYEIAELLVKFDEIKL